MRNFYLTKAYKIRSCSPSCYDANEIDKLFDVDELLLPTIKILNTKGYETTGSCSGHMPNEIDGFGRDEPFDFAGECYIRFKLDIDELKESGFKVPQGFGVEYAKEDFLSYKFGIYKTYYTNTERFDRFMEILETAKTLYLWAKDLPPRK